MSLDRRSLLRLAALASAIAPLCGFVEAPMPQKWQHIENNDPHWTILNGARVASDEKRGLMIATFTDLIRKMDGQTLTIGGFLLPLDTRASFTNFVLTRRNTSCPFCPPNEVTEAIQVFAEQPVAYTMDEFEVTGRFAAIAESSAGLFYRLNNARVRRIS